GRLMKFIPNSVMIGFVNALAIMIFMAQIEHIFGISLDTYVYLAITLLIVYLFPRLLRKIPAPLIGLVVLTAASLIFGSDVLTVGDLVQIERSLPGFITPAVPFTSKTVHLILLFSLSTAVVGLVEILLTAIIVDSATDSFSNKNRESRGPGIYNFMTGFFG